MTITKTDIVSFLVVIACVVLAGAVLYLFGEDAFLDHRLRNREQFKEDLKMLGVDLIEGKVESPSVIITLTEKEEFLQKISDLKATVVYYEGGLYDSVTYCVFEENMLIAYKFWYSGRD